MSTNSSDDYKASDTLPFSPSKQEAVLGHLLTNEKFFLQCKDKILPQWFAEPFCQVIWKTAKLYYDANHRFPHHMDVFEHPAIQSEAMERRNKLKLKIETAVHNTTLYAIEQINSELTEWLKARYYMEGVYRSRDLYNRGQTSEAYREIKKTASEIEAASFTDEKVWDFENVEAILHKRQDNVERALTWGLRTFNSLLLPEGNGNGCLLPGTTTTLVGPINAGKTTVMMTVACANMGYGKKVLYIPHEGSPDELRAKFLCCMLNRNLDWLNANAPLLSKSDLTPEEARNVAHIRAGQHFLQKSLTFMPMIRQGLTVEAVCAAIRRRTDEIGAADGKGFDLVISDYPAKLTTEEAKGGKMEHRHKIEVVYMGLNRLGEEMGFHHLNGAQVNREGNKINKGFKGHEKRLLEMEDFAEAFGPMADTATVITINRDPTAESQNRLSLHCAKTRTGRGGWTVVCRSSYGNSISHAENLGCTWYRGSATGTERLGQLLDTYRNQQIPYEESI